ncbi:MAG TPA: hypothetical protein VG167_18940 [Verrucomicrobiae bacterium]|nr:hypothetical protein [Verrucomicrobiae bacterium]
MAFQISSMGPRDGVKKYVAGYSIEPVKHADQAQVEIVKHLIAAEIDSLPAEFNAVRVEANCDAHKGGRTVQLQLVPLKLHL